MRLVTVALVAALAAGALARPLDRKLSLTPPMGWMSWEIFRCDIDCADDPDHCISDELYKSTTDALTAPNGFLDAGYDTIHIDDCWERKNPPRDTNNQLVANATRFPNGMKSLADYVHQKGARFGLYTAESPTTCGGYPASANHEQIDAKTFADWGVDYLKVDGCGDASYYPQGYKAMGEALYNGERPIVYSCSWPAYLGANETTKPYDTFIANHCNLWRNYRDIQCNWGSLADIIEHWGQYDTFLQKYAGPGHWNDPDMLLIGNDCITDDEARTQMAIWSIIAAPLIMGNDLRNISSASRAILLNKDAIAVNQDPMGQQGLRIATQPNYDIWARNLSNGDVAVGLYSKTGACVQWNITENGYYEECGPANKCFTSEDFEQVMDVCCADETCAGFSYKEDDKSGCYKRNTNCGFVADSAYTGFFKPSVGKPTDQDISINFADVGLSGSVKVYDIWQNKVVATTTSSYTAKVPSHGTAFLRLSKA